MLAAAAAAAAASFYSTLPQTVVYIVSGCMLNERNRMYNYRKGRWTGEFRIYTIGLGETAASKYLLRTNEQTTEQSEGNRIAQICHVLISSYSATWLTRLYPRSSRPPRGRVSRHRRRRRRLSCLRLSPFACSGRILLICAARLASLGRAGSGCPGRAL